MVRPRLSGVSSLFLFLSVNNLDGSTRAGLPFGRVRQVEEGRGD